ncbi:valyl-tRNA synthetase [Desulfonauticus submarinus]|uniref:Valine--tRNA ligase n=1 Tax=Desulfonauticus submarinus TaxID=206665 RepID=A0A1H0DFJ2_9BACT|nr:valine--tRNA ligase [Desulfonauticus submarinus]SDN69047.1 valyl-tRNA synthetase [Desulfonauticus submarinus]
MPDRELPKGYEPKQVEDKWISFWEEERTFSPKVEEVKKPYSIVIPPPNVTGTLHMGHALNITLQDILCRFHRQIGYDVLWVPGTDHAGIATQNVVEKALAKEGKTRQDLGRDKFIDRVWEWKEEYGGKILNQVRKLGASVDWTRLRFTMDEGLSKAVREVFVQLYEEGLIYKGDYIINWCPRCHTALADLEVEYSDVDGGLYYLRYPLKDDSGEVIIATTRPETMLGDTAVAVNPKDERYSHLIGKKVVLPLVNREIPIIGDAYVDMEFGTGCLKVTPAHDVNDFELGRKHKLESVKVIDDWGKMTEDAGEFAGLDRFECRKKIVDVLKQKGFLVKQEPYKHSVGHCYRCNTVIEPYVSKQWFVKVGPLAKRARDAVAEGKTKIYPEQWTKTYFEWLDNIRDWCISRQIWWGHRIPAWTCEECGKLSVSRQDLTSCPNCGSEKIWQEEDVLDTWFSSALWPFSTLGWPEKTKELEIFYPTSALVTGFDILFFWVARMMMMGLHFMKDVPFKDVYIHALVRDAKGQKMSKSKGNVIDPLVIIEKYGTDALRFTLTAFAAMGRDIKLSEERIEGYRHFINKIWNAARFALMNLEDNCDYDLEMVVGLPHEWILHRLEEVKQKVKDSILSYNFNEAAQSLYQFVWHEFCDWYLELIKPALYGEQKEKKNIAQTCLRQVLGEILILLHPIIPFVTQEIWTYLPGVKQKNLAKLGFPPFRPEFVKPEVQTQMEFLQGVISGVRNIKAELGISLGTKLSLWGRVKEKNDLDFLLSHQQYIETLARLNDVHLDTDLKEPEGAAVFVVKGYEFFVPVKDVVDIEAELKRLAKELNKIQKDLNIVEKKLSNDSFLNKAPKAVVEKEKAKKAELEDKKVKLEFLYDKLKRLK